MNVHEINELIKGLTDTNGVSDGFHTFGELYDHRCLLWVLFCQWVVYFQGNDQVWRSFQHSDGSKYPGWFMLGIGEEPGKQITYHLPEKMWLDCCFARTVETAPPYDGHTPEDVLCRLKGQLWR